MEKITISDLKWSDILDNHYIYSLLICVLAVLITFVISWKFNLQTNITKKVDSTDKKQKQMSDELVSDITPDSLLTPAMTKSPALAAEKVIQANMTEEQRKFEYEIRQKQLAQIHELMLKQSDKFGNISLSDVEEQMKLYQ